MIKEEEIQRCADQFHVAWQREKERLYQDSTAPADDFLHIMQVDDNRLDQLLQDWATEAVGNQMAEREKFFADKLEQFLQSKRPRTDLPVVGVYDLSNTAAVLIHEIKPDTVVASINGYEPQEYSIEERFEEEEGSEDGLGFLLGELWIPFSETMRRG